MSLDRSGTLSAVADLLPLEEARAAVLNRIAPLAAESVALPEALGRVLAEPVVAQLPVQAFDNSQMDGFAVRAADTEKRDGHHAELRLVGESRAGSPSSRSLAGGEAISISTGAVLPEGADAIVPVEQAELKRDRVRILSPAAADDWIRRAGEDIAVGAVPVPAGTRLGPAELGVLASLGRAGVSCHRRVSIRILTSGDELVPAGETLHPGEIYDSNALTIPALARLSGARVENVDRVADDHDLTREAMRSALVADILIICGGVSVGAHDYVKRALAELSVEQVFWRIALKPGRPTWFGRRGSTLIFGLPGNPLSAMVAFLLLVRPTLDALSGQADSPGRRTFAVLDDDYRKPPGRAHAVPCQLRPGAGGQHACPMPPKGSHVLSSMLGIDALALIDAPTTEVRAGSEVEIEMLRGDA
jgi:molybdopterin molybdotransferase